MHKERTSLKTTPPSVTAAAADTLPAVYMLCAMPYSPSDENSMNFGLGNLVVERHANDTANKQAGDYYFTERGSNKILCYTGIGNTVRPGGDGWVRRDDLEHSGCFFFLNGNLATFNPEEPGAEGNGVAEFRVSRIGNA